MGDALVLSIPVSKPRLLPTSAAIVFDATWSWTMTILVTGSTGNIGLRVGQLAF